MPRRPLASLALLVATACEVVPNDAARRDTGVAPAATATAATARSGDTAAGVVGVPAVPSDSQAQAASRADGGALALAPANPRRGGVIVATAPGLAPAAPRCSWDGDPLPCHTTAAGVTALIPLPADQPPGRYLFTVDRPTGTRIAREIGVSDHAFGRELVFLPDSIYRLAARSREIARDARALRTILRGDSPERRWTGAWREPIDGQRSAGYGVERFYYRASDSTRSITLSPSARARGTFGSDTASTPSGDPPSWRHAGVDFPARRGTAVVAPAAGIVAEVGEYILTGRTLLVDHGQGVFSAYFHLDTTLVREGDEVRAGRAIARVGSTGLSTGPHLHYGVYLHGRDVDPALWRAASGDLPPQVGADRPRP